MFCSLPLRRMSLKRLILIGFLAALPGALAQERHGAPLGPTDNTQPRLILQSALAGMITSVQISPDGRWFASASAADSSIRIHEIQSGAVLRTINAGGTPVEGVAVTPDS